MDATWIGFDLDDVIMRGPFHSIVEPTVRRLVAERSPHARGSTWSLGNPLDARIAGDVASTFHRFADVDPVLAFDWDALFASVAHDWGVTSLPEVVSLVDEALVQPDSARVLAGAREALDVARHAGFRVAAMTNGLSKYQRPILERLDLDDAFDDLVTPDRAGAAKPAGRFFAARPGLTVHVGDSLWQDVRGARRAGIAALWVHDDAPDPATVDAEVIAAHARPVARRQRKILAAWPDDPTIDLTPDAAGRTAVAALQAWLGR